MSWLFSHSIHSNQKKQRTELAIVRKIIPFYIVEYLHKSISSFLRYTSKYSLIRFFIVFLRLAQYGHGPLIH